MLDPGPEKELLGLRVDEQEQSLGQLDGSELDVVGRPFRCAVREPSRVPGAAPQNDSCGAV
ncbi:hypothetical protein [Williamsia sp. DF01-3]|uniref:hypothetical protein n=1 Tax=Williamsia sp. DF01-3 TaxID=2934157 RepID=UPI001FF5B775|nr:hypothetical protein [Williamsia sp. DF01-3]MCK0517891.1 hypothetical protein [Williamsia sp. DF01-3]